MVAFRPYHSNDDTDTYKLKGLDAHAHYEVTDADSGETAVYTGRYLMESGLKLYFSKPSTSHMIYFTKQSWTTRKTAQTKSSVRSFFVSIIFYQNRSYEQP